MSKNLDIPGWIPLLSGFSLGVFFIKLMDLIVPEDPTDGCFMYCVRPPVQKNEDFIEDATDNIDLRSTVDFEERMRKGTNNNTHNNNNGSEQINLRSTIDLQKSLDFTNIEGVMYIPKKMLLMVLAVTIHNIPEGLVLGMSYGGLAHENGTKLHDAIMLTVALGLQNIPEGLAVSIPIWRSGSRRITSFCYGQLSGFVEVISAVIGSLLVTRIKMILPYSLCFAAGAMIYVVCKELIPTSQTSQKQWGIFGIMFGFAVMMTLDVAFE
eukprot:TRINITY_DN4316_c0_g1_i1.p1 TRINITY_DN4316_c0_g1~~TRINITY_DN4316_c0_g1_i1.p1  ORF type:complete len:274 (-),score=36.94 TRINITY_DN4316_c0_g1_i1:126-926(-)